MNNEKDCNDGHLVVKPGDVLGSRYEVEGLLGKGTFGKVVRVKDIKSKKRMAIKISVKDSKEMQHSSVRFPKLQRRNISVDGYDMAKEEKEMLKKLNELDPEGKQHFLKFFDTFDRDGRIFLVVELLSISVYEFQKSNGCLPFPTSHVQHIAYQICQAVAFLHKKSILHTDIKPENVVFVRGEYDETPYPDFIPNLKGCKPKYRTLRRTDIRIIDFGSAVDISGLRLNDFKISTREYRCVECVLGLHWGRAADMWSVGCTIFDMFCGFTLFDGVRNDAIHLEMMEDYLGPLPEMFLKAAPKKFLEERNIRINKRTSNTCDNAGRSYAVDKRLKLFRYFGFEDYPLQESNRMYGLVARMLDYIPEDRMTANEALEHPVFLTLDKHLKNI